MVSIWRYAFLPALVRTASHIVGNLIEPIDDIENQIYMEDAADEALANAQREFRAAINSSRSAVDKHKECLQLNRRSLCDLMAVFSLLEESDSGGVTWADLEAVRQELARSSEQLAEANIELEEARRHLVTTEAAVIEAKADVNRQSLGCSIC